MKKRVCFTILLSVTIFSLNNGITNAFEMPKAQIPSNPVTNFSLTGNNANFSGQIGTINASVAVADGYMNNSIIALSNVLLSKEASQESSLKLQEIVKLKNPKERAAAINKIVADNMALINADNEKGVLKAKVAQLSMEQKKLYSDAVFNVGFAGLNYIDAGLNVTSLVQSISANPTSSASLVFQLKDLKKMAISLPEQAKSAATLSSNLVKIGTAGKIQVKLPTSKTEKPKEIKIDDLLN